MPRRSAQAYAVLLWQYKKYCMLSQPWNQGSISKQDFTAQTRDVLPQALKFSAEGPLMCCEALQDCSIGL